MSKQRFLGGLLGASPLRAGSFTDATYSPYYDLSAASNQTDVSWAISTLPIHSFGFSSDGLNMYASDYANNRILMQPLGTAYDPSDDAAGNTTYTVSGTNLAQGGLTVSPDGTKAVWDQSGNGTVSYVTFSTAWDASTGGTESTYNMGVTNGGYSLDETGTVAVYNNQNGTAYRHTLSTPWDPSTGTLQESLDMVSTLGFASGYWFRKIQWINNGNSFLVMGHTDGNVRRVDVTTPYTFSGATLNSSYQFTGITSVRSFNWANDELMIYDYNGGSSTDLFRKVDVPALATTTVDRTTANGGILSLDEAGPEANGSRNITQLNWGGISGRSAFINTTNPSLDLNFDGQASSATGDTHWDNVVLSLDGSSLSDDLSTTQNDVSVYTNSHSAATGTVSLGTSNGSSVPHPYGVSGVPYIDFAHGDGLQVPSTFDVSGGDWTFECWARFEAGTTGTFDSIFSTAAAGGIQFYYDGTTLKFDKASGTSLTHTAQITLGQWHHVAMTFDYSGGVLTMFIDGVGVSVTSANWVSDIDAYFDASQYNLVFGVNRSNGYPLDGQLTDIRFTAGVIRYTADFEEPKAKLPTAIDASVGTRLATDIVSCTRSTTATFRGSNGLIQTAAVNTPRVEYDASGNALGLLVEESRTNMLTKSSDMTHSDWTAYGSLGVTGGQADPAGGTDAVTLNDGSSSAAGQLVQVTATGTAGATYTGSIYVKKTASAASELLLRIKGDGEPQSNCKVDTLNGVVSGNSTAKIEAVNSDWWRVSVSATLSGNVTITMSIFPAHADAYGASYNVGSIGSHIVYGPQIEQGEAATSYIPTDTTTVTRDDDDISLATSSFGYDNATGTTVVDASVASETEGNDYPRLFEYQGATDADRIFLRSSQFGDKLDFAYRNGGTQTITDAVSGPITPPFSYKVGIAHSGTTANHAVEGVLGTPATIAAMTNAHNTLRLGGQVNNTTNIMNGHIRRLRYWPRAISDGQLAEYSYDPNFGGRMEYRGILSLNEVAQSRR